MKGKKDQLLLRSSLLKGKKIILGVTGSISAVECVKLIHEIRRHSGDVYPVMTESAKKIINPYSLEYASENKVIEELTGSIEHVRLVENGDLLLVAPATANSMSKMSLGIDDTTVTSVFSNSLGKIPVIVAPAMHQNMFTNPIILKNIETLRSYGVRVLEPVIEESKAKIADIDYITAEIIRALHDDLAGRRICIIGGSSYESLDDVRGLTNRSTGETAVELAKIAYYLGADLDVYFGRLSVPVPSFIRYKEFTDINSLVNKIEEIAENEVVIVPAALSDFSTQKAYGKISSDEVLSLKLKPAPKFLKILRSKFKGKIIGFKAEFDISDEELLKRARDRMKEYSLDMIVADDLKDVKKRFTKVLILDGGKKVNIEGEKSEVARRILESLQ